jgi:hypothetical protein
MPASYSKTSPYFKTEISKGYLDIIEWRRVPFEADDVLFTVTQSYENRPDLLAHDLYGDVGLWWVFSSRNPSVLKDPVFDLRAGIKIFLPKMSSMKRSLGL